MKKTTAKFDRKLLWRSALVFVTLLFIGIGCIYFAGSVHRTPVQTKAMSATEISARKSRITDIYASLKMNSSYLETSQSIFGEKRIYEWDKSRSYSSSKTYIRQANVDATVAEMRKSIEGAGFKYFEEPYPGSVIIELHFKSAKNEYIRLSVSSKPRDDSFRNTGNSTVDPNQGPSNVTVKVNLDDNNE